MYSLGLCHWFVPTWRSVDQVKRRHRLDQKFKLMLCLDHCLGLCRRWPRTVKIKDAEGRRVWIWHQSHIDRTTLTWMLAINMVILGKQSFAHYFTFGYFICSENFPRKAKYIKLWAMVICVVVSWIISPCRQPPQINAVLPLRF